MTSERAATAILSDGFQDGRRDYMTGTVERGVWLSDRPLDANEGAWGDAILVVKFPPGADLSEFEWQEDDKGYREWLIPASRINGIAAVERL